MIEIGSPPLTNYEKYILGARDSDDLRSASARYHEEQMAELIERFNSLNVYYNTTENEKIDVIARVATTLNDKSATPELRGAAIAAISRINLQFEELIADRQKQLEENVDMFGLF